MSHHPDFNITKETRRDSYVDKEYGVIVVERDVSVKIFTGRSSKESNALLRRLCISGIRGNHEETTKNI